MKRTAVILIASACAAIVMALALAAALPDLTASVSLRTLVFACAAATAFLGIIWARFLVRSPRRELARLAASLLVAAAIVTIARPSQELPLSWRITGNREQGQPLPIEPRVEEWGVAHEDVAAFHATEHPDDATQPW